jgi:hypothetical protein
MAFSLAAQSLTTLVKTIRPMAAGAALSEVRQTVPKIMVDLQTVCSSVVTELDQYMLYLQYAAAQNVFDVASVKVVASKFSSVAAGLLGGRKRFGVLHKEAEQIRLRSEKEDRKLMAVTPPAVWTRRGAPSGPQTQFSFASLTPPQVSNVYAQPQQQGGDVRAVVNLGRAKGNSNPAYRGSCYACAALDLPPAFGHSIATCPNLMAATALAAKDPK